MAQLNKNQKRAVEYLDGPLLVLAGPGTGKTQLLSEKVRYILENIDIGPENILCMTFTETGAANMRERLKTLIGAPAAAKVNIYTYHAFGSEILAEYANYSADYNRKLDSAIDEVAQFKLVKSIQQALPARDILQKDNVKDIISVISAAKSANLTAADLEQIAEQNTADSKVLSEQISPLLLNVVPRKYAESRAAAYEPIYDLIKEYTEAPVIVKNIERSIGVLARGLREALIAADSEESVKPLTKWRDTFFEKDDHGNYRLKDYIANKKLASIATVMAEYDQALKSGGLYDYDDMIQEAVKVLKSDAGFKATLSERYQYIMLDEFQDTNPSQFSIIKELTDYESPNVMAVGDDDQAIYEFQGALSTNLTDFQNHYGAEVIPLTENYRSTQEILDFSREIINQADDRFADKELTAHREAPAHSQIYRYEFLASDMEYSWVARKIHDLVKSGVRQSDIAVISYKHKYFMPLLPYLAKFKEIKVAYERRDNLLENDTIRQIITISRYIYELATESRVDTSALEILSYPFWNLPIVEIIRLTERARRNKSSVFDEICASSVPSIREVGEFLAALVAKSYTEPLEIWLDELIGATEVEIGGSPAAPTSFKNTANGESASKITAPPSEKHPYRSPFLAYYANQGEYEAFTLYEKLASLRGRLHKHFGEEKLRLHHLIELVDDYNEAGMPMNATSPYQDADEAIQILSAHKAKGLEFSHVFVLAADHSAWGKGKGNNNMLSLPKNLLQIRHTGTTDGEKLRILYVTLTRAKEYLYITNSLRDFEDKSPDRLEYLEEYTEDDKVISPYLPTKEVTTLYEATKDEAAAEALHHWVMPYARLTPDMRSLYKERVRNYRMSASSLTSFIDIVYAGPVAFFRDYILEAPREPVTEEMAYGTLVHTVFEAVTKKGLTDDEAVNLFLTEAAKYDLSDKAKKRITEKGAVDIRIALNAFGHIIRQGEAEVNLASEHLVIAGVPVTGKIDHIIINEDAKTLEIYDFKTGVYKKDKWKSQTGLYKYMLQLLFYKMLLKSSRKYGKYKIEKAHILFVTPDNEDKVYDKEYIYEDADEQNLLLLMSKVYEQISSLDFLSNPAIFKEADNNLKVKDIIAFVEKLLEA
ncbi:ATP-dependent helicase [Candidatus Saccharibacteria bacterium]|nr:ATP-dependent helicase [Candidatus Saccharibacteria bacterium]